ncbi:hypothetical protein J2X02_002580 [Pseudoxanthomonas japonensis]|uniref:hypothetical protein n=1 Tax=Pseudoxanthomonas TaxID=83618 RepID=UPI000784A012|nr:MULTISPECIES: hypothetical protein [Pseudoxanthomonas]MBA3928517.1 hypothetical protein [Xanthomonas sp.]MBL8256743.1 hypothetical protein [Pseudoxanthomonas mexicana]MDR7069729.1 hypothetical protein [Pseudoxanthomonas japonensis]
MSGTLARRIPTRGAASSQDRANDSRLRLGRCQAFVAPPLDSAQDQATAQQDPDIAAAVPVARLHAMPASLPTAALRWLRAVARTLAGHFRRPADPSSSSPATGRSAMRLPFVRKAAGFREFTLPRHLADGGALRLRVKSAGVSTRIAPVAGRRLP